jgi:hypothetical protein
MTKEVSVTKRLSIVVATLLLVTALAVTVVLAQDRGEREEREGREGRESLEPVTMCLVPPFAAEEAFTLTVPARAAEIIIRNIPDSHLGPCVGYE